MNPLPIDRIGDIILHSLEVMEDEMELLSRPDYPDESLHRYRVNGRRVMTLAELLYRRTEAKVYRKIRKKCRRMVRPTRDLRDLDVALSALREQQAGPWFIQFHGDLVFRKKLAYTIFHKTVVLNWQSTIDEIYMIIRRFDDFEVDEVLPANQILKSRLQRVLTRKEQADLYPVQKSWHKLRLAVKHLRYSLDSCYPEEYVDTVAFLKTIQDDLGWAHDADVQMDFVLQQLEMSSPAAEVFNTIRWKLRYYSVSDRFAIDVDLEHLPPEAREYLLFLYRKRIACYESFLRNWEANNSKISLTFA